jgi:hypothetical protein
MAFDAPLSRITLTGALLPYDIAGNVKAVVTAGGLELTASASFGQLLMGFAVSIVGVTVLVQTGALGFTWLWSLVGIVGLVTALHVWQTANVLRRITQTGTTL